MTVARRAVVPNADNNTNNGAVCKRFGVCYDNGNEDVPFTGSERLSGTGQIL